MAVDLKSLIYVDGSGFHYPDFNTILTALKDDYKSIYGNDVYLGADSQDGQYIASQAVSIYDLCNVFAAVYNSFSPLTAMRDALSRNVKINGIKRATPSYSTVDLVLVGVNGTVITGGKTTDAVDQVWNLPASVTIPITGTVTVTATSDTIGAVYAEANTVTRIATPTRGWQTVNNPVKATVGSPVEEDWELRKRRDTSVAIPSLSVFEGIIGSIADLPGVKRYRGYENDTAMTNADGIPGHHICMIVEGGVSASIAQVIARKKTPGTGTHGTTSVVVADRYGVPNTIKFYRPTPAVIGVTVNITSKTGWITATSDIIKAEIVKYLLSLEIGDDIIISKLGVPANLLNDKLYRDTFDVTSISIKKDAGMFVTTNITLAFNEMAFSTVADIILVIT
jgi:uncharacterized phage protein gp47/JayE